MRCRNFIMVLASLFVIACSSNNAGDESKKITKAMIDISQIATALLDYATDTSAPPPSSGIYNESNTFYNSLCPKYIKKLPIKYPWGHNYLVYCGKAIDGQYGIMGSASDDFLVVSLGKDGLKDNWIYDPSNPSNGIYDDKDAINKDLAMLNGSFIRGPRSFVKN